jgi:hypothetical protein
MRLVQMASASDSVTERWRETDGPSPTSMLSSADSSALVVPSMLSASLTSRLARRSITRCTPSEVARSTSK